MHCPKLIIYTLLLYRRLAPGSSALFILYSIHFIPTAHGHSDPGPAGSGGPGFVAASQELNLRQRQIQSWPAFQSFLRLCLCLQPRFWSESKQQVWYGMAGWLVGSLAGGLDWTVSAL